MDDTFEWFLGIDWGSATHQFCLIDSNGEIRDERPVDHVAVAVQQALDHVRQVTATPPDQIAVAVELTRGVLVDTLLDQGFRVFAINPKQLDRFRDRFTSGGAKDDRRDARAAADGLRTDPRAFRALQPEDPRIVSLRELSRMLDDLQTQEMRMRFGSSSIGCMPPGWY